MTAQTGIENTSTSQINISPKGSRKASPSRIETIPLIAARLSQLPCMVSLKSTKTAASSIASLFDLLQSSCTVISSSGYNLGCLMIVGAKDMCFGSRHLPSSANLPHTSSGLLMCLVLFGMYFLMYFCFSFVVLHSDGPVRSSGATLSLVVPSGREIAEESSYWGR